jgi:uncharacterized Tic20 family protein
VIPITLAGAVWIILYIIGAVMIWGLVKWLIDSNPWMPPQGKQIANYVLIVLVVLICIGFILSFISGQSLFRG